jgi:hypothetical protein
MSFSKKKRNGEGESATATPAFMGTPLENDLERHGAVAMAIMEEGGIGDENGGKIKGIGGGNGEGALNAPNSLFFVRTVKLTGSAKFGCAQKKKAAKNGENCLTCRIHTIHIYVCKPLGLN